MSISENATGGEFEPDVTLSENQENPQDVAAEEAASEDTRDAVSYTHLTLPTTPYV